MNTLSLNDFRATAIASIDKRVATREIIATTKKVSQSYDATLKTTLKQLSDDVIATALIASNVDATHYEATQLNAIKKENYILSYLFDRNATLREYIAEIFASAYIQQKNDANAYFTKDDAKNVLTRDHKMTDAQATFYQLARSVYDVSTISSQHKTTLDALVSLNVFTYHSTLAAKHCYRVNFASELTTLFAAKLNITIEDASDDSDA